ncbi:MAG: DegT/DnrJ/EryC1/StrS family aminotransferase, partial [Lentisphaerota bacterium]
MSVIPQCNPVLGGLEKEWLLRCIDSGFVSSVGPMISEFEQRFAAFTGARYAVATASGTTALHAALHALNIRAGDAVGVADLTFVASVNPVLYCGAEPVLIDVDPDTWCMDMRVLQSVCKQRLKEGRPIKAVIPVHLYGNACDLLALDALAAEYGFMIVEDATEALG